MLENWRSLLQVQSLQKKQRFFQLVFGFAKLFGSFIARPQAAIKRQNDCLAEKFFKHSAKNMILLFKIYAIVIVFSGEYCKI
ncbi:MAG: hypothetical protein ONA90_09175, partial [candidate division KSB1 bacterium]|nr:hypothetical protein [candidate division KSB1 bacterium]